LPDPVSHRHDLIHGHLSVDKCHVDARWTVRIVDWEYTALYDVVRRTERNQTRVAADKSVLYFLVRDDSGGRQPSPTSRHLAPEIQSDGRLHEPTRAGDVYSFGVVIRDLFVGRDGGADEDSLTRMPFKARQLTELACDKVAVKRPTFDQLEKSLRCIGKKTNLLERCVDELMFALNDVQTQYTYWRSYSH